MVLSQVFIGYSIWLYGGEGRRLLLEDVLAPLFGSQPGASSMWAAAVLGVAPLIALSRALEKSESPLVASLNLSTNLLIFRLFGPRPQPLVAGAVSLGLAALTAVSEEVMFRGVFFNWLAERCTDDLHLASLAPALALVVTTVAFALGHVGNPFKGLSLESLVLLALQLVTGATFGFLRLSAGGLGAAVLAHTLYDFYTFLETHLAVTTQIQYANNGPSSSRSGLDENDENDDPAVVADARRIFRLMDTNRDGAVSRKELRVALYSYGVVLSEAESERAFQEADLDESGLVTFDEFCAFIQSSRGEASRAIKRALLGNRL